MFFIRQALIVLLSCILTAVVHADEAQPLHRLTLLTENFGTFNYSLTGREFEHGQDAIGGTSADFVKRLMARAGIPYKMKLRAWHVSYERALSKPNYGVFSTARTEVRENLFDWVGPIARYNWVVLVNKGSSLNIQSIDDLRGLRVGGYQDGAVAQYLESQGIEVSALDRDALNPGRLKNNLIDVWASSDASAWSLAKEAGYENIEVAFVLKSVDMYLAMNKDTDPDWLALLHESYDALVAEGQLNL